MRRLVLQMSMSLDGDVASRSGLEWELPDEHPDVAAWKVAKLRHAGTHIMGRVTYEEMAAYWPTATGIYAGPMNDVPKVVFSTSLTAALWDKTSIARGELAREVTALKQQPGGEIVAHGGATFVQALSRSRLIDEYRLVIRPVALGDGLRLFADLPAPMPLRLIEAHSYRDGTAIHVYEPAPAA
ncbi:MAG: dihydrofolate reductase family protein [Acidobacteriaceae bacterium]|nr:dihydrofolate reductase family protein [Acidobacteriaceae bacterium]